MEASFSAALGALSSLWSSHSEQPVLTGHTKPFTRKSLSMGHCLGNSAASSASRFFPGRVTQGLPSLFESRDCHQRDAVRSDSVSEFAE